MIDDDTVRHEGKILIRQMTNELQTCTVVKSTMSARKILT